MRNPTTRLVAFFSLLFILSTPAANHPLSRAYYDPVAGVTFFDLVMTLGWDPSQQDLEDFVPGVLSSAAERLFDATEGKHKLRTVYLFENNAERENCDIYFQDVPGRANANLSAFGQANGDIELYTRYPGSSERNPTDLLGEILGHEFGHYIYGLYDEYAEASGQFDGVDSMPQSSDEPCDCYMANHQEFIEFCITDGHSTVTAQHRMRGAACWNTLTTDPALDPPPPAGTIVGPRQWFTDLVAPIDATEAQTGGESAVGTVFLEVPGVQLVSLLDRSGSMEGDKLTYAKAGANILTELAHTGDRIGIIAFDTTVTDIIMPPESIPSNPPHTNFQSAIFPIVAGGNTAMGDALRRAWLYLINSLELTGDEIETNTDLDRPRAIVLLSDGLTNVGLPPQEIVPYLVEHNIRVYAVGIGDADWETLHGITTATGGQLFYDDSGTAISDTYAAISELVSANDELVDNGSESFDAESKGGSVKSFEWPIDSTVDEITLLASWGLDDAFQITLRTPSGVVITQDNAVEQGVHTASFGEHLLFMRVPAAETGTWTMTASSQKATGFLRYSLLARGDLAKADDRIHFNAAPINSNLIYPEPLRISASLFQSRPITRADVWAWITAPDGELLEVRLRDDGLAGDPVASDGVYSGMLDDFEELKDGLYDVVVRADNFNGAAVTTNAMQVAHSHGNQEERLALEEIPVAENFMRAARFQVRITGIQPDTGANTRPESLPVRIDNTPTFGLIETRGDVDYYRIAFPRGTLCTIRVAEVSPDMEALLQLYDPKERVVGRDVGSYGRGAEGGLASEIVWRSRTGGTYFAKVENRNREERGRYTLYVHGAPDPDPLPETPTSREIREAGDSLRRAFAGADGDADGVLSFDEARAAYAGLDSPVFDTIDLNGNGTLDPDELDQAATAGGEGEGEGEGESEGGGCRLAKPAHAMRGNLGSAFLLAVSLLGLFAMTTWHGRK